MDNNATAVAVLEKALEAVRHGGVTVHRVPLSEENITTGLTTTTGPAEMHFSNIEIRYSDKSQGE